MIIRHFSHCSIFQAVLLYFDIAYKPGHWIWMVMLLLLRLSLTAGPLQILNQIPRDGEMLKFGAFATSPASPGGEFGASPLDTPRSAVVLEKVPSEGS